MAVEAERLSDSHPHEEDFSEQLMHDPRSQEELNTMVLESMQTANWKYYALLVLSAGIMAVLLFGVWGNSILKGLGVTGLRRPNFWGIFLVNFVFWIGISHAGTFVSAILRVFKAEFRRPFTRAAELMTTFGLIAAFMYPIIHLGRPWRTYWILPYPNQRQLWPNFRSPILWDIIAITTYLISSTMYLYLPLIPDLAMARDRTTGWKHKVYKILALGWRGTEKEWKYLHAAINVFAFAIIPVMFSVHTIVSWDFAVTRQVGWHTTIFGPFFIVGAILSGVSAVTLVLIILRYTMKNMKYFIRPEHLDALGKLILVFSMTWAYFFFNEFFLEWYGGEVTHHAVMDYLMYDDYAPFWWSMLFLNMIVPWATLWSKKIRRSPLAMIVIAILINIGMWFERYVIVTGMMGRNRFPFDWGGYVPSLTEISITIGSFGLFIFLYAAMSRLIPLIPVWEVKEGQEAHTLRQVGKAKISSVSELE